MSIYNMNRRITELDPINKLTGKEYMLIDNAKDEASMKVTVDTLLGYIAEQINKGTFPEDIYKSCNIVEIPIGDDIPIASRVDGYAYLRTCELHEAQIAAGIDSTIIVSPNMALRIIED